MRTVLIAIVGIAVATLLKWQLAVTWFEAGVVAVVVSLLLSSPMPRIIHYLKQSDFDRIRQDRSNRTTDGS